MRCRFLVVLNRAAINGAVRQLSHWLPSLDPDQFVIRIAYLRDRGPLAENLEPPGVEIRDGYLRSRLDPIGAARLFQDARAWLPHVVFSLDERNATILARIAGTIARARVIQAVHSSPKDDTRVPLWDRATRRMVHTTLAVSRTQKELLVSRGVRREHIHVVYNAVPPREAIVDNSGGKEVTAVFLGVLRKDKRVDLLIRALAQVRDYAPNLRLSVIGAGRAEPSLRRIAGVLGVDDRITWAGWQMDSEQYLKRASFLVLPSDPGVETLSMAVLEAMALGLPVICTDVGSMREVVDSSVGSIVPPGDVDALAQAMLELYENEALRARKGLAAAARQRERFSSIRLVGQMEGIILAEAGRCSRP